MKKIDDETMKKLWGIIDKEFGFNPDYYLIKEARVSEIFTIKNKPFKIFKIDNNCCGSEKWQEDVNNILKNVVNADMYALDWQHECFMYNPNENITLEQSGWGDDMENCCFDGFPSYYPNGDYFLFIDTDFSQGILGVPGFNVVESSIFVIGDSMIKEFEKYKEKLFLTEIQ